MNLINYAKTEFKAQFYTVLVKSSKFILKIFDFLFHLLDFAKTVLNWTFSFLKFVIFDLFQHAINTSKMHFLH